MSVLNDKSITIYEALENIQSGKYIMPAFQRQYVWNMGQIEKLWDSILLDYPIATFLFWHVDDNNVRWDTYICNFLYNVTFNSRRQPDDINYELSSINLNKSDTAVLDGQQRLTSLLLSLYGDSFIRQKHTRKKTNNVVLSNLLIELNKNKLTVDEEDYNSMKYDIKFSDKICSPTQFKIKDIIKDEFKNKETRKKAIEDAIKNVPSDSKDYARSILNKLYNKVFEEKLIRYTEIKDMEQDDALEMFVRFNSGGRALRKSEITMSILGAYWPNAKEEFGKLLIGSYDGFGTDFIIRTALMLYGDVTKSNINKEIADELKNRWSDFKKALKNLEALLAEMKIDLSRFSNSWNVLLPIIYSIYKDTDYKDNKDDIRAYLVRAILFTYFQSGTTAKLQQMKTYINQNDYKITVEMLNLINDLRVTDGKIDDIINSEKGSRVAGEALYYLSLDWINKNYKYEQDHLHPYDKFDYNSPIGVSMEEWKEWRSNRNRLPNLQYLEGRSNGSKGDMRLLDYYNNMNDHQKEEFCKQAIIPDNVGLELKDFGDFYEKRKVLLTDRLRQLLG